MKEKIFLGMILMYIVFNFFVTQQAHKKALYDFDEARYAEVAKNVIKTGDLLVQHASGPDDIRGVYFWKPPLQTWIIAGSYKLFGVNELAVRLPSLLFAIGSVIVAYLLLRQLGIGHQSGLLALAAVVLSSDFSFLSSQGVAEMQLLFINLLCLYLVERGIKDKKTAFYALAGVALGLGVMTKFVAVFWVCLLIFYYLLTKRISWKDFAVVVAGSLAVALPWHLYMLARFGNIFINRYVLVNTFGRGTGATANIAPLYWYGIYMIDSWRPLVFLLPFMVTLSFKDKTNRYLLIWALLILIPFSVVHSKVWWYIFPAMIPLAVLAVRALRNRPSLAVLAMAIGSFPIWQLQYGLIKEQVIMFGFIFLGFAFITYRKRKRHGFISLPLTAVLALFLLFTAGAQERKIMEYTDMNKDLKAVLIRHKGQLPDLAVYKMPYEAALFYSDTGTISNDAGSARYILTERDSSPKLDGFRRIDQSGRLILLKREKVMIE